MYSVSEFKAVVCDRLIFVQVQTERRGGDGRGAGPAGDAEGARRVLDRVRGSPPGSAPPEEPGGEALVGRVPPAGRAAGAPRRRVRGLLRSVAGRKGGEREALPAQSQEEERLSVISMHSLFTL